MGFQRQQKTSEPSALVKMDLVSRIQASTESSQNSCARVVTSLVEMALEERAFMVPNLQMRTSRGSTLNLDFCQWLTLDPTQMAHSSSSLLIRPLGLMESMLSLVK